MQTVHVLSLSDLLDQRQAWNQLWAASTLSLPTVRAEGLQLWCDTFARDAEFKGLVVEQDGRFVAALPLVEDRKRGIRSYRLPSNGTVKAGDLLIDPNADVDSALETLAQRVVSLGGFTTSFTEIEIEADHWKRFFEELTKLGCQMHASTGHAVGVADVLHDWDAYQKSWSRNHRSMIRRSRKKLDNAGELAIERMQTPADEHLYEALEECYAVEDRSWKGANGTSILKTPGLREYYHREARLMRDCGLLDLWLMKLDGQVIAFEYCQYSKGTCFSHKISFDPRWQKFSPGRVLRSYQLERYHEDSSAQRLDTLGVLCEAKAKWVTRTYVSSRCVVSTGGFVSNLLLRGFKIARHLYRRIRPVQGLEAAPKPGAAKYLQTAQTNASPACEAIVIAPALPVASIAAPFESE